MIAHGTTHRLGDALLTRRDDSIAFIRLGPIVIVWPDRSRRAAMTTIPTEELLGDSSDPAAHR